MPDQLSLDTLSAAVAGDAVALRAVTRLMPAGGPADKVFPPTYAGAQYVYEDRWIEGERVKTVLLDSVPSQANRLEQALLQAHRLGQLHFPLIGVDFTPQEGLRDLGLITTLDAPHRIADAIFRDSLHGEVPFRLSEPGRRFTEASVKHATALFELCPTALLFGVWDSTGPRGGQGAKFERSLVSEIIGVDPVAGHRTGSRLDPLQIRSNLGEGYTIFRHRDPRQVWTFDESEAARDDKGASRRMGQRGQPSAILHGNITPDLARAAETLRAPNGRMIIVEADEVLEGGVTMRYALHTTVLSLVALRRLAFPQHGEITPAQDRAAQITLAALALTAIALGRAQGYDLRSRCLLVPDAPLEIEFVPADGGESARYRLDGPLAIRCLEEAVRQATHQGLAWERQPLRLTPAPKLVRLIRRSRELEFAEPTPDSGGNA